MSWQNEMLLFELLTNAIEIPSQQLSRQSMENYQKKSTSPPFSSRKQRFPQARIALIFERSKMKFKLRICGR